MMGPHQIVDGLCVACQLQEDLVGGQGGHVTVDTIGDEQGAVFAGMRGERVVAAHAPPREGLELSGFVDMDVVAGGAV